MTDNEHDESPFIEVDLFAIRYWTAFHNPSLTLPCECCGRRTSTGFRVDAIRGYSNESSGEAVEVEKIRVIICPTCFKKRMEARLDKLVDLAQDMENVIGEL